MVRDEILRPKILDVIGRFAGISSSYLNSFDIEKGPDIVFAVENESLLEMLQMALHWGELKRMRRFIVNM